MEILKAIEASGFAMFVKESSTAYTAALALHTIGLVFLVGISGGTAMRILGVARSLPLEPMEDFFPLMWAGFWINAVTGLVLLLLYPTTFLFDATFYIKIAAVMLAMLTIRLLRGQVFGDGPGIETAAGLKRAKALSISLLSLWLVAITTGRVLAYTLPTKIQTAAAVVILTVATLLVGYFVANNMGWLKAPEKSVSESPSA